MLRLTLLLLVLGCLGQRRSREEREKDREKERERGEGKENSFRLSLKYVKSRVQDVRFLRLPNGTMSVNEGSILALLEFHCSIYPRFCYNPPRMQSTAGRICRYLTRNPGK